jgi:Arc/MetJ-type ribon-helix-helix transcriptional regulator
MTARPRTTTLEIDEELHEFLALMVNDAGPYQSVSAYVEDLIRRDRASQEAAAFTQLQAELAAGFGASESTYQLSSAAEVIARNRI